jgi:mono/diheme cytochrome c family protein
MHALKLACGLAGLLGLSIANAIPAGAQGTTYTTIERGRDLVNAGDCASCHTDEGGKPYAGGLAVSTPFGTIYSTNITPDPATGIGKWSEQEFYRARRQAPLSRVPISLVH